MHLRKSIGAFCTQSWNALTITPIPVIFNLSIVMIMLFGMCIAFSARGAQSEHTGEELGAIQARQADATSRLNMHDERLTALETSMVQIRTDLATYKSELEGLNNTASKLLDAILAFLGAIVLKGVHMLYTSLRWAAYMQDRRGSRDRR